MQKFEKNATPISVIKGETIRKIFLRIGGADEFEAHISLGVMFRDK